MAEPLYRRLYPQVLAAMAAGIAVGVLWPETGAALRPLGDGFVKLVKMLIAPIIFCTVVAGIAGMRDLKRVGLVGLKAALYFEAVTTVALLIGLAVVHTVKPGAGMNAEVARLDAGAVAAYTHPAHAPQGAVAFLLAIIPETAVDAFARGDILQVLFLAILFGAALARLGPRGHALAAVIEDLGHVVFGIVAIVMRLAPIGAFGAMAFTVGTYGIAALAPLAKLMACFYATCLLFVGLVLGAICRAIGLRLLPLLRYLREELLIVLGTSSSESVLPRIMKRLEALGASRPVVGLVVPAGYSFNLDGTAIYLTMAAIFIAQATNTELSARQELTLLAVLLVSSKGAAGVTGSGFVTLAATLAAVPTIPVAGLALILGVDRFMSEARALTNLVGNCVATLVIARWEGDLDVARARAVLAGEAPAPSGDPPPAASADAVLDR